MKRIEFSVFSGVVTFYTLESLKALGGSYENEIARQGYIATQWNNFHMTEAGMNKSSDEQHDILMKWRNKPFEPYMDEWAKTKNIENMVKHFSPIPGVCRVFILTWYQLPQFKEFLDRLGWAKYVAYEAPAAANRNYPDRKSSSPYLRNTLVLVNYPEEAKNA